MDAIFDSFVPVDGLREPWITEMMGNFEPSPEHFILPRRRRAYRDQGQWIRRGNVTRINSDHEVLTKAHFLARWNAFVLLPFVLFSLRYTASYIFEDTLHALGFTAIPLGPHSRGIRFNPRGGWFYPIGRCTLNVRIGDSILMVDFYVLPGSPAENGVLFILGKPDLARFFGRNWTPQQYVENVPDDPNTLVYTGPSPEPENFL